MNTEQAINILRRLRPRLAARGIAHAGVFGSVARGEAGERSDVDVVVTPEPGAKPSLFDCGAIQLILEEGFSGIEVDVVVEPVKSPDLARAVNNERIDAF